MPKNSNETIVTLITRLIHTILFNITTLLELIVNKLKTFSIVTLLITSVLLKSLVTFDLDMSFLLYKIIYTLDLKYFSLISYFFFLSYLMLCMLCNLIFYLIITQEMRKRHWIGDHPWVSKDGCNDFRIKIQRFTDKIAIFALS